MLRGDNELDDATCTATFPQAVYEQIAREASQREDREAIKSANLEAQSPSWLKRWQQTNS